ncbi:MAG: hypothetical protein Q7T81_11220 [Pseudolabrys sp.]|nr:hypothetical protein [Pseudolabrys sp.]
MTTIAGYSPVLTGNAGSAYGVSSPAPSSAKKTDADQSTAAAADSVTLSEAAKAYLAATPIDAETLAKNARAWLDQQYKDSGISSALIGGKVAVDFTSQSRATLSAIAANSQSLFSKDETVAAAKALSDRFDTAITPHVVIARHLGDYAGLYQAADKYLELADTDERATALWQSQKQAVTEGIALTKVTTTKAPETSANDPVAALLTKTSQAVAEADADAATTASSRARQLLDAQANAARDAGTTLVFDPNRKTGQQADFSKFDNQALAVVTLNADASFSTEEARAAKKVLDQRNRESILAAFSSKTGTDVQSQSLALLSHYSSMSSAEKAAMGYTDAMQTRLIQNYRTASMFSGGGFLGASAGGSGSLTSYL